MKRFCMTVCLLLCLACLMAVPARAEETGNLADVTVMGDRLLALNARGILTEQNGAWTQLCQVRYGQLMAVSGETVCVLCEDGVVRFAWQDGALTRQDVLIAREALPDAVFYSMAVAEETVFLLGLPSGDVPYTRKRIYAVDERGTRQLAEGDYTGLLLTGDGRLLTLLRGEEATRLMELARDTGKEKALCTLDGPADQGLLDGLVTRDGYAWAAGQARLYRMNLASGAVEIAAYLPVDNGRAYSRMAAALDGDAYRFVHSEQGLMSVGTDPATLEGKPLRVTNYFMGLNDETLMAFARRHPTMAVEQKQYLYGSEMSNIVQAMINQDGGLDVFTMELQSTGYAAVRDKGYCAPLESSEVLTDYVAGMYPAFADALWHDGRLCAIPVSFEASGVMVHEALLEELGLTVDDLPTTFMELMDFIAAWDTDQPVKLLDCNGTVLRRQLFYVIRDTQEAWCAAQGIPMTWDTPEVLALLEKLDEISPTLNRFDPTNSGIRTVSETLLRLLGNYAPSVYSINAGYRPLLLARAAGEECCVKAYVSLVAVNPYSASQQEAIDLLECVVQRGEHSALVRMLLNPDLNEPVENRGYAREMALIAEERVRYGAMLEDETLSQMERDNAQHVLELYDTREKEAEANRWAISPEEIARWREIVPHVYVMPTPNTDVLLTVRERYIDGQLTAAQYIREAEGILTMIRMEQE